MELQDIEVGQRYRHNDWGGAVEVVDATPDRDGDITGKWYSGANGEWEWAAINPSELSPIVERYTVELRPPKAGERYLLGDAGVLATCDFATIQSRFVIVDGDA